MAPDAAAASSQVPPARNSSDGASAGAQQQQLLPSKQLLWEYFVVLGLPSSGLQTVHGEGGFLGTNDQTRYKPALVDSLAASSTAQPDERCQLPPQLPTCCLPTGIDIVLHQDLDRANLTPHTFACVLTEGDGSKLYASCLAFYDRVPSDLCAKHDDLLGGLALKALCLLSRQPYLASSERVLRELHSIAFHQGSSVPLPDLIHSLLAVPCPRLGGPKVCLQLGRCQRLVCPPLPLGPPPGELPLQPLLESLKPEALVGLFAAVLLEQRVLLRSRHHWLLTVAAEGVVRLMHPLTYQHVFIPVMPCCLADYLEAPTPFLMGLHSSEPVEGRVLDLLVVADLDAGTLQAPRDDVLLRQCMGHPYMQRLLRRVRVLMQPSVTEADVVTGSSSSGSTSREDPWVAAARALGTATPWSPSKQALLLRVFMEFFHDMLRDHQLFLTPASIEAERSSAGSSAAGLTRRDSRVTSGGGGGGSGGGGFTSARALRAALSLSGTAGAAVAAVAAVAAGGGGQQAGRVSGAAAGGLQLQAQSARGMQALLEHHASLCKHKSPALLQQVMQSQPFLCFLAEAGQQAGGPHDWLRHSEAALSSWREAEEALAAGTAQPAAAAGDVSTLRIPDQSAASPLMPPGGLVHATFPPLILSEACERAASPGLRKRRGNSNRQQRRPSGGRRRAISELMGSPMDLHRKSPTPQGTSTDTSPPRLLRNAAGLDTGAASPGGGGGGSAGLQSPLTPGLTLPSLSKISNVSATNVSASLSEEYSAEADLVRRQTGMLVHLMQAAATAAAAVTTAAAAAGGADNSSSSSSDGPHHGDSSGRRSAGGAAAVLRRFSSGGARSAKLALPSDVLEAARQLLCIQTGGNGWFIVSRLKELVANPPAPFNEAELAYGSSGSSSSSSATKATAGSGGDSSSSSSTNAAPTGTAPAGAGKKGGKGSSPQQQPGGRVGRSGSKLLGVALSSGSKSSGLAGLKVSHGVESFASAASAMASAISRNASATKARALNSGGSTSSPTNTVDSSSSSKAALKPLAGPLLQHSASCRQPSAGTSSTSSGGISPAKGDAAERSLEQPAAAPDAVSTSSGSKEGVGSAAAERGAADEAGGQKQGQQRGSSDSSSSSSGTVERLVPPQIFSVLGDMLNALVEVAAAKDDSRVVLSVLELAAAITCQPAAPRGPPRRLLSALSSNSALRTEWFWASAFSFAVSSTYLSAQDFVDVREVVVRCLHMFAFFMAGVGIAGPASWVLLMQMATDHLAHIAPLDTETQLSLRHHLARHSRLAAAVAAAGPDGSSATQPDKQQQQAPSELHASLAEVSAALQACGISPSLLESERSSSSAAVAEAEAADWSTGGEAAAGASLLAGRSAAAAAFVIPAPNTAAAGGDSPVSASPGALSPVSSLKADAAAPTQQRPPSPLKPGNGQAARGAVATAAPLGLSLLSAAASQASVSCYASGSSRSPRVAQPRSPGAREGGGGYAGAGRAGSKQLGRQGLGSSGSSPTAAAAAAAAAAGFTGAEGTAGGSDTADMEAATAAAAAAAAAAFRVQGDCLREQGGLQWGGVHSSEVLAVAAASYTAVTVGRDGWMRVLDLSAGVMRLAASMQLPGLQGADGSAGLVTGAVDVAALPVVKLWHGGKRAGIGNATREALWVVDLERGQASLELSGLGSAVSCLLPLHRNPDALLSGLSTGSISASTSSSGLAGAYLWDLRKPRKPASSLDYQPEPLGAAGAADGPTSGSVPGVLCLSVHEDGALAAAGLRDGRVLVWDMRKPDAPLSVCRGHASRATHIAFLPTAASVAAGLGRVPLLLSGSADWTARVWDAETGCCRGACVGHGGALTALQVVHGAACGTRLLTGGADGTLGVWRLDGELVSLGQRHTAPVMLLQQGGDTLVSGASDKSCHVWGLQQVIDGGSCSGGGSGSSNAGGMPLDHNRSAVSAGGSSSSGQRLQQHHHAQQLLASQRKRADVAAMAFDPVGELLCSGHRDGIVSVWNCSFSMQQQHVGC